ncbi:helix-turn-helix domain-containing protein [uncultured Jatrophihabitans sp.]|uniref:helix-turn-helix domain-containing protein n=1 Tax=uncultured Jatrophihabitans sp. TaxID=1610747 RepID=UPI0035C981F6
MTLPPEPTGALEALLSELRQLNATLARRPTPSAVRGPAVGQDKALLDSPWLVVGEVQAYARAGKREVLAALADGSLRGYQARPNGRWRIHRDDVDAWLRG